jgi:hypothetical protein
LKPTEAVKLTRTVKALCPHQAIDAYTPDAWHVVLGHLDLADCMEAVAAINGRQPFIAPSDIIAEIASQRGRELPHSQACRAGDCKLCLYGAGESSWCMHTCHPRAVKVLTGPNPPAPQLPKAAGAPELPAGPKRYEPGALRIGRDVDR